MFAAIAALLPQASSAQVAARDPQAARQRQQARDRATTRAITADEFLEAMEWAEEAGLKNLDPRSRSNRDLFRRRGRG